MNSCNFSELYFGLFSPFSSTLKQGASLIYTILFSTIESVCALNDKLNKKKPLIAFLPFPWNFI